jgi:hypothetical protein
MRFFLLFIFLPILVLAQDPHQKKAMTIDEILQRSNVNKYNTIKEKANFLVVDNLRTGQRIRFYNGDIFRFKTKESIIYQEEISEITDSTFSILFYDLNTRHLSTVTFLPADIDSYYKRNVRKGVKWGLTWASLGALAPLIFDWAQYKRNPLQNTDALIGIPIIQSGIILLNNKDKFFNKQKIKNNTKLKIFKSI